MNGVSECPEEPWSGCTCQVSTGAGERQRPQQPQHRPLPHLWLVLGAGGGVPQVVLGAGAGAPLVVAGAGAGAGAVLVLLGQRFARMMQQCGPTYLSLGITIIMPARAPLVTAIPAVIVIHGCCVCALVHPSVGHTTQMIGISNFISFPGTSRGRVPNLSLDPNYTRHVNHTI